MKKREPVDERDALRIKERERLAARAELYDCASNMKRDPLTGRCIKEREAVADPPELYACAPRMKRDALTGRCIKEREVEPELGPRSVVPSISPSIVSDMPKPSSMM